MCVFGVSTARNSLGNPVVSNIFGKDIDWHLESVEFYISMRSRYICILICIFVCLFIDNKQLDVNIALRTKTDKEA